MHFFFAFERDTGGGGATIAPVSRNRNIPLWKFSQEKLGFAGTDIYIQQVSTENTHLV